MHSCLPASALIAAAKLHTLTPDDQPLAIKVKAVICTSVIYWPGLSGFPPEASDRGVVSAYAWGEDYHRILGEKLKLLATWLHTRCGGLGKWYVDTGALMERDLGERAGLGFVGKNSLLIAPRVGSGMFLGEILTTLPLRPVSSSHHSCSLCLWIRPTKTCMIAVPQTMPGRLGLGLRPTCCFLRFDICELYIVQNHSNIPNIARRMPSKSSEQVVESASSVKSRARRRPLLGPTSWTLVGVSAI